MGGAMAIGATGRRVREWGLSIVGNSPAKTWPHSEEIKVKNALDASCEKWYKVGLAVVGGEKTLWPCGNDARRQPRQAGNRRHLDGGASAAAGAQGE